MRRKIKNKKIMKLIGVICIVGIVVGTTLFTKDAFAGKTYKYNSATNNITISNDGIIQIPMRWTVNPMNQVNASQAVANTLVRGLRNPDFKYEGTYSKYEGYTYQNVGTMFNGNEMLPPYNSFSNTSDLKGDSGFTMNNHVGILKMKPLSGITFSYETMEKWFNVYPQNKKANIPQLPDRVQWYRAGNKPSDIFFYAWRESPMQWNRTTADTHLFRGVFNLNNVRVKEDNGQYLNMNINPNDYEFFLGTTNPKYMFLGINDYLSVFVDEQPTNINYGTGNGAYNLIMPNGTTKTMTFTREYRPGSTPQIPYYNQWKAAIDSMVNNEGIGVDKWYAPLVSKKVINGHGVVLGNVTNIIRNNGYGPTSSQHMVDLLTQENCAYGGVTELAIYAIKKPTLTLTKIPYLYNKQTNVDEDLKSTGSKVPLGVPVYYKFKITNNSYSTDITNVQIKDIQLNKTITSKSSGYSVYYMVGNKKVMTTLNDIKPRQTVYVEANSNNKNLLVSSNNLSNKVGQAIVNTATASGTYFYSYFDVNSNTAIANYIPISLPVSKSITSVYRNGKNVTNSEGVYKSGDIINYSIKIKNPTDTTINGLRFGDNLKGQNGYSFRGWKYTNLPKGFNINNFSIQGNSTIDIRTSWRVPKIGRGFNINKKTDFINSAYVYQGNILLGQGSVKFSIVPNYNIVVSKIIENYNSLNSSDKEKVNGQSFYINIKNNTTGKVQTIALTRNLATGRYVGEFINLDYGDSYTVYESIPMNYKFGKIKGWVNDVVNKNSYTFIVNDNSDNKNITIYNSYDTNNGFNYSNMIPNIIKMLKI